jgi:preprotein translocase subunit SecA
VAAGGLHIIGTERHESRRIDNQLRGRAGRQGDPGSSRFYLSLDDDLMKRFASDRVAGLMERMGLDDESVIESRLVSKTIESAQSRVEGFNFDIRKRVVEFDDVINKQRETIYAERDKVLQDEDLGETVTAFIEEEIDALVDQHLSALNPDDWSMEALHIALKTMGLEGDGLSEDDLWDLGDRDAIAIHLHEAAERRLEARREEVGEHWALAQRFVLLQSIDRLWVEHLTELDDMRRGIGLRGYAQQDPLNEFRREAYRLYEELRGLIRHQVASTIFRVQVTRQPAQPPVGAGRADSDVSAALARGAAALTAAAAGSSGAPALRGLPGSPAVGAVRESLGERVVGGAAGASAGGVRPGYTPSGERIGRNDACYCGSGQKYKKCHGR